MLIKSLFNSGTCFTHIYGSAFLALDSIDNVGGKQREGLPDGGASSQVKDIF